MQFSLRQKTRLGALRARDQVLMLQSLLWDDEVREADFGNLDGDVRVSAQELKMSASLVDNMSTDFAPDKFSDEYQEQLRQLIAASWRRRRTRTAETFGEEPEKTSDADVIDLMEALRQSVERNKARAGQQNTAGKGSAAARRRLRRSDKMACREEGGRQESSSEESTGQEERQSGKEGELSLSLARPRSPTKARIRRLPPPMCDRPVRAERESTWESARESY